MPYAMDDPRYYYKARTPEQRHRLSLVHKKRLGIPPNCVGIYGIHVPEDREHPLRNYASWVRQKRGLEAAKRFVQQVLLSVDVPRPYQERILRGDQRFFSFSEFRRALRMAWFEWRGENRRLKQERDASERKWRAELRTARKVARFARHWGRVAEAKEREQARAERALVKQQYRHGRAAAIFGRFARYWGLVELHEGRMQIRACRAVAKFARWTVAKPRGKIDWALAEILLEEHASREELAEFFGVSLRYLRDMMRNRRRGGLSAYGTGIRVRAA